MASNGQDARSMGKNACRAVIVGLIDGNQATHDSLTPNGRTLAFILECLRPDSDPQRPTSIITTEQLIATYRAWATMKPTYPYEADMTDARLTRHFDRIMVGFGSKVRPHYDENRMTMVSLRASIVFPPRPPHETARFASALSDEFKRRLVEDGYGLKPAAGPVDRLVEHVVGHVAKIGRVECRPYPPQPNQTSADPQRRVLCPASQDDDRGRSR